MPIRVTCPGCAGGMTAPDAAAGRTLKCPKCSAGVPVPAPEPAFEVVDDEPVPVEVVDDEPVPVEVVDDEPAATAAPKKKKKKKVQPAKSSASPGQKAGLIVGGVFAGLLVLYGLYSLIAGGDPPDPNLGADGWYTYQASDNAFVAEFPGGPPEKAGINPGKIANIMQGKQGPDAETARVHFYTRQEKGRDFTVLHKVLAPGLDRGDRFDPRQAGQQGAFQVEGEKPIRVNGLAGRYAVYRGAERTLVMQQFQFKANGDNNELVVLVGGDGALDPEAADVRRFLDRAKPVSTDKSGARIDTAELAGEGVKTRDSAPDLTEAKVKGVAKGAKLADVVAALGEPTDKAVRDTVRTDGPNGSYVPTTELTLTYRHPNGASAKVELHNGAVYKAEYAAPPEKK